VLIAVSVLTGYNVHQGKTLSGSKENVNNTYQGLETTQTDTISEWQQFKIDAQVKINANEKKIDEFKADMKTDGKNIKAKYKKEVVVLEKKNKELKKKISEYKYDGKVKWEEFEQGFNHDMDVVGTSIKNLFSKNS
jgi:hypothetical protein